MFLVDFLAFFVRPGVPQGLRYSNIRQRQGPGRPDDPPHDGVPEFNLNGQIRSDPPLRGAQGVGGPLQ